MQVTEVQLWDLCSLQEETLSLAGLCSPSYMEMRNCDLWNISCTLHIIIVQMWYSIVVLLLSLEKLQFWAQSDRPSRYSWCHQPNIVWETELGEETHKYAEVAGSGCCCLSLLWKPLKFSYKCPYMLSYISRAGGTGVTQKGSHHPQPFSNSWWALKQRRLIPVLANLGK